MSTGENGATGAYTGDPTGAAGENGIPGARWAGVVDAPKYCAPRTPRSGNCMNVFFSGNMDVAERRSGAATTSGSSGGGKRGIAIRREP